MAPRPPASDPGTRRPPLRPSGGSPFGLIDRGLPNRLLWLEVGERSVGAAALRGVGAERRVPRSEAQGRTSELLRNSDPTFGRPVRSGLRLAPAPRDPRSVRRLVDRAGCPARSGPAESEAEEGTPPHASVPESGCPRHRERSARVVAIRIQSAEQFGRLLDALLRELVDASIHWQLRQALNAAGGPFAREMNEARTFWGLTRDALEDSTLFRLCKIYDTYPGALNLKNLLETIDRNLFVFDTEQFRERLKDNLFVESLAAESRAPDPKQLQADLAYVSKESNPKVENLVALRNNFFAHRSSRDVLSGVDMGMAYPLTVADVSELLERGTEIANRYSRLFRAAHHSTQMVGADDYRTVLTALRWHVHSHGEARREEAVRRALRDDYAKLDAQKHQVVVTESDRPAPEAAE